MQYLVMMTARPEPLVDGEWIVNAVGRKSRYYQRQEKGGNYEVVQGFDLIAKDTNKQNKQNYVEFLFKVTKIFIKL